MLVGPLAFGHVCVDEWFQNPLARTHYRPQRSCGQGNIFAPVCHSVHRGLGGGVWYLSMHRPPPRSRHPPSRSRQPPGSRPPPGKQTPAYGQRAAGTHPTGMHSCFNMFQTLWTNLNESYGVCWARVCGPND